ncbi:MAG: hypothetical protein QOK29_5197, partial [Rhodospirillaceae bacterium]|nr:hypothetical protein [Rhodospirillaceae bacterium]
TVTPDGEHVIVTGRAERTTGTRPYDVATVSYAAGTGSQQWASTYDGADGVNDDGVDVVAAPDSSAVYVAADLNGGRFGSQFGALAYSPTTGSLLWKKAVKGSGVARSEGLSAAGGNLVITGGGGPNAPQADFFTVSLFAH